MQQDVRIRYVIDHVWDVYDAVLAKMEERGGKREKSKERSFKAKEKVMKKEKKKK